MLEAAHRHRHVRHVAVQLRIERRSPRGELRLDRILGAVLQVDQRERGLVLIGVDFGGEQRGVQAEGTGAADVQYPVHGRGILVGLVKKLRADQQGAVAQIHPGGILAGLWLDFRQRFDRLVETTEPVVGLPQSVARIRKVRALRLDRLEAERGLVEPLGGLALLRFEIRDHRLERQA